jgi:hypothetical protein
MRKFTTKEVDWLKENYSRLGRNKCAEAMGRTPVVVSFKARSLGLSCPRGLCRGRRLNPTLVVDAYKSLNTIEKVAKHFGASETTIANILKEAGFSGRPKTPFERHQDTIVAEYLKGDTYGAIAARYGISKDQVRYGIKRLGITDSTRRGRVPNRKPTYESWVIKYGKDEADRRWIEYKKKLIKNARRGEANHRFGKPAPQGTGNGWKGWYRGHYFRSLREAMFMIDLDSRAIKWKTAETEEYAIIYELSGKTKTYRPDFVVGKELWELKPVKLHLTKVVVAKRLAAEEFCKTRGLTYRLEDILIDKDKILRELDASNIRFDRDYEERFRTYLKASPC